MRNICPKCSFEVKENFCFCPNCGTRLKETNKHGHDFDDYIICGQCGEKNSAKARFCSGCGSKITPAVNFGGSAVKAENKAGYRISNLRVLLIIGIVVVAGFVMLLISGVFSSGGARYEDKTNMVKGNNTNVASSAQIDELKAYISNYPDSAGKIIELANMLFDSKQLDEAIEYYNKYLTLKPDDADARVDLGICYFEKTDYDGAIRQMETALRYDPKHIMAHYNLGIVNLNKGNLEKAKIWFNKVIELNPNSEYAKKAEELLKTH